jgi:hypothetical protein
MSSWWYEAASRLSSLANNLAGTLNNQTLGSGYNRLQLLTHTATKTTAYIFTPTSASKTYAKNGLNQYTSVGGVSSNEGASPPRRAPRDQHPGRSLRSPHR